MCIRDSIAAHPEEFRDIVQRALLEPAVPAETDWNDCCYYQQKFEESFEMHAQFENREDKHYDASEEEDTRTPQTKAEKHRRKRKLRRREKGVMIQEFALPCEEYIPKHRKKYPDATFGIDACVARPVGKKEIEAKTPKGMEDIIRVK